MWGETFIVESHAALSKPTIRVSAKGTARHAATRRELAVADKFCEVPLPKFPPQDPAATILWFLHASFLDRSAQNLEL